MELAILKAKKRAKTGKGVARKLRNAGLIPAVCYRDGQPSVPLSVSPKDLRKIVKGPKGVNTVFTLQIEDENGNSEEKQVMLHDYQYHPVTRRLLHADFYIIELDQEVEVKVPLVLVGRAEGVKMGGTLIQVFRELPVKCKPLLIPTKIEYDITPLGVGAALKVKDLKLPEGVKVTYEPEQTIVHITMPEKSETAAAQEE